MRLVEREVAVEEGEEIHFQAIEDELKRRFARFSGRHDIFIVIKTFL